MARVRFREKDIIANQAKEKSTGRTEYPVKPPHGPPRTGSFLEASPKSCMLGGAFGGHWIALHRAHREREVGTSTLEGHLGFYEAEMGDMGPVGEWAATWVATVRVTVPLVRQDCEQRKR